MGSKHAVFYGFTFSCSSVVSMYCLIYSVLYGQIKSQSYDCPSSSFSVNRNYTVLISNFNNANPYFNICENKNMHLWRNGEKGGEVARQRHLGNCTPGNTTLALYFGQPEVTQIRCTFCIKGERRTYKRYNFIYLQ